MDYAFRNALGISESGGDYSAVNDLGYTGKYQWGNARLAGGATPPRAMGARAGRRGRGIGRRGGRDDRAAEAKRSPGGRR